jgi:HlyD family secretion protein
MTSTATTTQRRQGGSRALLWGGTVAVAMAGFGLWYLMGGKADKNLDGLPVAKVMKGPLRISVLERGNLRAKRTTSIRSELEGESKLLYIIQEGKNVKEGELLVELDVSQQVEKRVQQKISYDQAEANFIDAKEKLAIQDNLNESNIKKAELQLETWQTTLTKYLEGDFPQKKQAQEAKIKIAEQELSQARDRYEWSKKLYDKGFITKTEFEKDELDVNRAQIDVDLAKRELEVLEKYDDPLQRKTLKADVDESERELERTRRQALAEHAQAEANLKAKESTLGLEKEKLKKLDTQIEKSKILAPTSGVVVYAGGQGGNNRRQDEMITVGARVNQREELLELPDPSRMVVEARFHESVIDKISLGQPAVVTVDSAQDRPLAGRVTYMSVVPDSQARWMNPDLRVYKVEVEVDGDLTGLRPQMSCAIEIVVTDLADATYVPVQSVFRRSGKPVCYVVQGADAIAREVELGLSNERNVEIKNGVTAGESVLMALPPGLQTELTVEAPKTTVGQVVVPKENGAAPADDAAKMNIRDGALPGRGELNGSGNGGAGNGRRGGSPGGGRFPRRGGADGKPDATVGGPPDAAAGNGDR